MDPSAAPQDGPDDTVLAPDELVAPRDEPHDEPRDVTWPYRPLGQTPAPAPAPAAECTGIVLVPYHSWARRGPSTSSRRRA
ncbi:hypothetical protein [Streptomyces sp. NPDC002962]|uniref:hypothetical protein n=1 Tax=Streptomyces sp. NPDC002962 TaxID=3364674 RepID=UPI00369C4376